MFVIATILICCFFDIIGTFIYVIPSLACGILYGALRKYNFKELELLCVSSVGHVLSLFFSFLVIAFLFKEVEFMDIFSQLFGMSGNELIVTSMCFFITLGFCESFLVHIVSDSELAKLATRVEKNDYVPKWFAIGFVVNIVLFIILYFVNNLFSVIPMILSFVFIVPYIVYGIMYYKTNFLVIGLMFVFALVSVFIIQYIEPINYLILPIFVLSPLIINNFQDKKEKNF